MSFVVICEIYGFHTTNVMLLLYLSQLLGAILEKTGPEDIKNIRSVCHRWKRASFILIRDKLSIPVIRVPEPNNFECVVLDMRGDNDLRNLVDPRRCTLPLRIEIVEWDMSLFNLLPDFANSIVDLHISVSRNPYNVGRLGASLQRLRSSTLIIKDPEHIPERLINFWTDIVMNSDSIQECSLSCCKLNFLMDLMHIPKKLSRLRIKSSLLDAITLPTLGRLQMLHVKVCTCDWKSEVLTREKKSLDILILETDGENNWDDSEHSHKMDYTWKSLERTTGFPESSESSDSDAADTDGGESESDDPELFFERPIATVSIGRQSKLTQLHVLGWSVHICLESTSKKVAPASLFPNLTLMNLYSPKTFESLTNSPLPFENVTQLCLSEWARYSMIAEQFDTNMMIDRVVLQFPALTVLDFGFANVLSATMACPKIYASKTLIKQLKLRIISSDADDDVVPLFTGIHGWEVPDVEEEWPLLATEKRKSRSICNMPGNGHVSKQIPI